MGELLGRDVLHAIGHAPEVRAQHLLTQMLHQLVEHLLCLRIDEPVVRQFADGSRRVGRKRVQEQLAHPCVVLGLERERAPFAVQDLLELFANLLERTAEVERLLLLLTHVIQPTAEGVEPGEPALHPIGASAVGGRSRDRYPSGRRRRAPRGHRRRRPRDRRDLGCRPSASSGSAPVQPTRGRALRAHVTEALGLALERLEAVRGADRGHQTHPARPLERDQAEREEQHEPRHQLTGGEPGERGRAAGAT